ncbi:GLPGLI family protein [Arcicella aurantiaca]|uniref:GLPGLI family protein n=1 Tax=Arcicella aurantiaca TaxID=591202 RepID=A0A316E8S8_9BACT|nr:GLPGLI family protein [Arcicella aurantiaca]PWK26395.1 GLPGLI family protein [Arcicella aurantiaca]
MKKVIIIIAIFLVSIATHAQQEGIVSYTRTTYWTKLNSTLPYLSKQEKEKQAYMFGGRDDWKEYTLLYFNEKESRYTHSEEKSDESEGYAWRKEEYNIRRNFEKNTMNDAMEMLGKVYIVEDSLPTPNWKILNDIKDVAGHICMKAMIQDTVKKQKIIAWFAQDIPINAGPERLYGLPGLILELDINDGAVIIEATKIENKKLTTEFDLPKKQKGKKINDLAFQDMLRKFIQEKIKEERNPYWTIRY